jgi:hypothetical protein
VLAQIFDDVVAHQAPELSGGNPHTALVTHDFGGMFTSAGQTDTLQNHPGQGISSLGAGKCAQYTPNSEDYKIILGSADL